MRQIGGRRAVVCLVFLGLLVILVCVSASAQEPVESDLEGLSAANSRCTTTVYDVCLEKPTIASVIGKEIRLGQPIQLILGSHAVSAGDQPDMVFCGENTICVAHQRWAYINDRERVIEILRLEKRSDDKLTVTGQWLLRVARWCQTGPAWFDEWEPDLLYDPASNLLYWAFVGGTHEFKGYVYAGALNLGTGRLAWSKQLFTNISSQHQFETPRLRLPSDGLHVGLPVNGPLTGGTVTKPNWDAWDVRIADAKLTTIATSDENLRDLNWVDRNGLTLVDQLNNPDSVLLRATDGAVGTLNLPQRAKDPHGMVFDDRILIVYAGVVDDSTTAIYAAWTNFNGSLVDEPYELKRVDGRHLRDPILVTSAANGRVWLGYSRSSLKNGETNPLGWFHEFYQLDVSALQLIEGTRIYLLGAARQEPAAQEFSGHLLAAWAPLNREGVDDESLAVYWGDAFELTTRPPFNN